MCKPKEKIIWYLTQCMYLCRDCAEKHSFSLLSPPSSFPYSTGGSHLNLHPRPDIDWTPHWPHRIPAVQSKHGLLTHLYPLLTNQQRLRAANRKMSAFLSSPGRKSVSLKACWETFSFFPSFPFSLPWQTVMNWSLIWLPLCQTEPSLSILSPMWARDLPGHVILHVPSVWNSPPLTAQRSNPAQQEHVSHMSHS